MPPRRGVRSTFFGATLPLYLVRLILVSSLVLIAVSTGYMGVLTEQDGWVLPAFFAFVFVHHTARYMTLSYPMLLSLLTYRVWQPH